MNLKHEFVLDVICTNGYMTTIYGSSYLNQYFYCKICNKSVEDMFSTKGLSHTDFGTSFEQEQWLNTNITCLTIEERIIKKLLE